MLVPFKTTSGGTENDKQEGLAYSRVPTGPSFGARGTGVDRVS